MANQWFISYSVDVFSDVSISRFQFQNTHNEVIEKNTKKLIEVDRLCSNMLKNWYEVCFGIFTTVLFCHSAPNDNAFVCLFAHIQFKFVCIGALHSHPCYGAIFLQIFPCVNHWTTIEQRTDCELKIKRDIYICAIATWKGKRKSQ